MLNYDDIVLKRLAKSYKCLQELYDNEQAADDDIEYWWNTVLCYQDILTAVYKEPFTLHIVGDIFIAYSSYISFTVNFVDHSMVRVVLE